MIPVKNFFLLLFFLSPFFLSAQQLSHVQGDIIVQLNDSANLPDILRKWRLFQGRSTAIKTRKCLSESMNIWVLQVDYTVIDENRLLKALRQESAVQLAQLNHLVRTRAIPNDANFMEQWQYINDGSNGGVADVDLDADLAWDITTGGVTPQGDTIVVAALDDGVDINHEDLSENLWRNHGEIPNNGIDDDGNGYVDDVNGWNIVRENGELSPGAHGTPVMGIMGARGNNEIGVAGVNWQVKLMMVQTDFQADEASIIAGYGYPYEMRRRYNETDGEEGAFVVAINSSWGIDGGMPEDAPIWCALYDSMGTVGILNVGATVNENTNVDVEGDLPTTCPSTFLLGVTNLNRSGEKEFFAGYGTDNIDLASVAENVYTVSRGNRYGTFGGTSAAAPHVTGAIGLLYAAPCDNFSSLSKSDPAAAALLARRYILEGVRKNSALDTFTNTGGQLNLLGSLDLLMENCGSCLTPFSISFSGITNQSATVSWSSYQESSTTVLRFRKIGSSEWTVVDSLSSPFTLSGLTACTDYEIQMQSLCSAENSDFGASVFLTTEGCCEAPETVKVIQVSDELLRVEWNAIFGATNYQILVQDETGQENQLFSNDNSVEFSVNGSCREFQIRVGANCPNKEDIIFSVPQPFTSSGCGSCLDVDYCMSRGDGSDEWIDRILLNTLDNKSGNDQGYGDYTGVSTDLQAGKEYQITVNIAYESFTFNENIQAWIDFNQDGEFDEASENIIDLEEDISEQFITTVQIPIDASPGLTRMRVAIKWREGPDPDKPTACETFNFGEVEDYCVNILPPDTCIPPDTISMLDIADTVAFFAWNPILATETGYQYQYRISGTTDWTTDTTNSPDLVILQNLVPCTMYDFRVQSFCDTLSSSDYGAVFTFETSCSVSTSEPAAGISELSVFPNPTTDFFEVAIKQPDNQRVAFRLFDTQGHILQTKNIVTSEGKALFSVNDLPAGVYLLQIATARGSVLKKVLKM